MAATMLALLPIAQMQPAIAVEPDEILDDPALEARAREVSTAALAMWVTTQTVSSTRTIQRNHPCGMSGTPNSRRKAA